MTYNIPKNILCPFCGVGAEYMFAHNIVCVSCGRKFWIWDANVGAIKKGLNFETSANLKKTLSEIKMLHELGT